MTIQTTNGIEIKVATSYEADYSDVLSSSYYFSYTITITNTNDFPAQLIARHWIIIDAAFNHKEVQGAGVVGQQPILAPGTSYTYSSACDLRTSIGKMIGHYHFKNLLNNTIFEADIPVFVLHYPAINN
jgi:ApaG protein